MTIRDWNPDAGDARQGDVYLFRVPDDLEISTLAEVKRRTDRLVLLEGEMTGHHHAIYSPQPAMFRDDAFARSSPAQIDTGLGVARLYRDADAARALVSVGELTRADLCIGFLVVEHGPVALKHEEHDAICIPVGRYYVGRQVESAGHMERIVWD